MQNAEKFNKFDNDGSFLDKFMKIKTENVNSQPNAVNNEIKEVSDDSDSEASGDKNSIKINDIKEDKEEKDNSIRDNENDQEKK